jgi:hypothetical protein
MSLEEHGLWGLMKTVASNMDTIACAGVVPNEHMDMVGDTALQRVRSFLSRSHDGSAGVGVGTAIDRRDSTRVLRLITAHFFRASVYM